MLKDLGLALDSAKKSDSVTPLGSMVQNLFTLLSNSAEDNGTRDFSSIQQLFSK